MLAVLASNPALPFLSSVTGVTSANLTAAVNLATAPIWHGARPALVLPAGLAGSADATLSAAGLARAADRAVAVRTLPGDAPEVRYGFDVVEADGADFVPALIDGYGVHGAVAAFIAAEHRTDAVRRFLALDGGVAVGAAAMTVHDGVAVFGGASTPLAQRGRGIQSLLLRHRLRVAADLGCTGAVATAVPDSVSSANLARAGFAVHRRPVWVARRGVRAV